MKLGWKLGGALLAATVVAGMLPGMSAGAAVPADVKPGAGKTSAARTVTLITGDRVTLHGTGADNAKVSVRPGAGRSKVTFVTQRSKGALLVIPSDAAPLLRAGRVDRRLFEVTTLLKFGYDDRRSDVPLIVTFSDGPRAKAGETWTGARVTRPLPSARGQAMRVNKKDASTFWRGLTGGGTAPQTLASGASKVWLDGVRQPSLDQSVPQIGAPAAWATGYTGTGVSVAVLDTGIDATHPDLADRVIAQKNFTEDPDNRDIVGHGTHVASTVAGSGVAAGGKYKGVAHGSKLLDGKVCESFGCTESAILAGMEWGAQNAKVINMSLGGGDTPEIDPLEEAVNTLTAQYGTLFVIAAGNSGPEPQSVSSPGSADAALTVGAVDKSDVIADFSSRGPRIGDAAIKPDITAPGVNITAARGKDGEFGNPGESYTALSGTSMATPHTAGAAAILRQQHPTWTPEQIKATLMASAKAVANAGVFDQGAGRVDLTRAITQAVTSTPTSVSFGLQEWPHGDDAPVLKTVTYRNSGTSSVTLTLTTHATGPGGAAAPAGMFTTSASTVTVPAGGSASVTVTANTAVPSPNGTYGGHLVATAGAASVRTPIAVDKEFESYNLTFTHLDRSGRAPGFYLTTLWDYGVNLIDVISPDRTVTVRVPKGRYLVSSIVDGSDAQTTEITQLLQPVVNVTRNQTINLDARLGKPMTVTVPNPAARASFADLGFTLVTATGSYAGGLLFFGSLDGVFTAQLGSQQPVPGLVSTLVNDWADPGPDGSFANSRYAYNLFWYEKGKFFTGFARDVSRYDLATVREDFAKHAVDGSGQRFSLPVLPAGVEGFVFSSSTPFALPFRRTTYLNTDGDIKWAPDFVEEVPDPSFPFPLAVSEQDKEPVRYRAGKAYSEQWNRGVFGPALPTPPYSDLWATRLGNDLLAVVPLYGDSAGHAGFSAIDKGRTTLFRNGKKFADLDGPVGYFQLPAGKASYRLAVQAERSAPFSLSTRINTVWTFQSSRVAGSTPAPLPLSVVRFTPALDANSAAPAGQKLSLPIAVQRHPGAASATTKTLTVEVSYDDGASWKTVKLVRTGETWTAEVNHPNRAGFVSLRAKATDTSGNTVEQTIIRAYRIAV